MPAEEADKLAGKLLTEDHARLIIQTDTDVYKPDGTLLLRFRKRIIPIDLTKIAFRVFEKAAIQTENRGMASGVDASGQLRRTIVKKDGTRSKQTRAIPVNSGVVGYFEKSGGRWPYCRMTAFNLQYGKEFAEALPFVQTVSNFFRDLVPERWQKQKLRVDATSSDFVIPGTVFTTLTVNKNWQTAVHQDAGDLKEGFGILTAIRSNNFDGCYLCFPRFRVAVDIRTCDLLFCDVHEWHGNTPIQAKGKKHYRLSFVFYYRERMIQCGSVEEELAKAKQRGYVSPT